MKEAQRAYESVFGPSLERESDQQSEAADTVIDVEPFSSAQNGAQQSLLITSDTTVLCKLLVALYMLLL